MKEEYIYQYKTNSGDEGSFTSKWDPQDAEMVVEEIMEEISKDEISHESFPIILTLKNGEEKIGDYEVYAERTIQFYIYKRKENP